MRKLVLSIGGAFMVLVAVSLALVTVAWSQAVEPGL